MKSRIDVFDKRVKYMIEEGSRFRGYKTPSAPPSLGVRVVAYITVYENLPPADDPYPGSFMVDYETLFERFNIEHYVNDLGVKEIWIWQGCMDGNPLPSHDPSIHRKEYVRKLWESNMSSPTTSDVSNSDQRTDDLPIYDSTYTVYAQNIRRTQAEAVHNRGHQLERILRHANYLQDGNSDLFVKKFVGQDENEEWITGRCGWTHMPPNTTRNYDCLNPTLVESDIEDWTPDNSGNKKLVNVDTWGDLVFDWPDGMAEFPQRRESQWYMYWMQNFPGRGNTIDYGINRMTNWWVFMADWDNSIKSGLGLYSALPPTPLNFSEVRINRVGGQSTISVNYTPGVRYSLWKNYILEQSKWFPVNNTSVTINGSRIFFAEPLTIEDRAFFRIEGMGVNPSSD